MECFEVAPYQAYSILDTARPIRETGPRFLLSRKEPLGYWCPYFGFIYAAKSGSIPETSTNLEATDMS